MLRIPVNGAARGLGAFSDALMPGANRAGDVLAQAYIQNARERDRRAREDYLAQIGAQEHLIEQRRAMGLGPEGLERGTRFERFAPELEGLAGAQATELKRRADLAEMSSRAQQIGAEARAEQFAAVMPKQGPEAFARFEDIAPRPGLAPRMAEISGARYRAPLTFEQQMALRRAGRASSGYDLGRMWPTVLGETRQRRMGVLNQRMRAIVENAGIREASDKQALQNWLYGGGSTAGIPPPPVTTPEARRALHEMSRAYEDEGAAIQQEAWEAMQQVAPGRIRRPSGPARPPASPAPRPAAPQPQASAPAAGGEEAWADAQPPAVQDAIARRAIAFQRAGYSEDAAIAAAVREARRGGP